MRTQVSLLVVVGFVVALLAAARAEIPQVISYQGKVTDAGGAPVADGDYAMTFTIYNAASGGTSLWSSGAVTVAVAGGVFSVLLGESPQPALSLAFDADYWVATSIEGDLQSPRTRLGSVGYSYMASGIVPVTEVAGTSSNPILKGTNSGAGAGVRGDSDLGIGVRGESAATDGKGMYGAATATTGANHGVYGVSQSTAGSGVTGEASATAGTTYGLRGSQFAPNGAGVIGFASATTGVASGVIGYTSSPTGFGVAGRTTSSTGLNYGVYGFTNSTGGIGVYGIGNASTGTNYGVYGTTNSTSGFAGYFVGRSRVDGDLTVGSGGRLGIGVTAPENPLAIAGAESDTPGAGAQVRIQDSSNADHSFAFRIGAAGNQNLHLDSYFGAWQTLMTVDRQTGRVGLGTDTPDRDLSVVGYVRAAYAADEADYAEISHGGSNGFLNWNGVGNFDVRYANSTKLTVQQDGNVGIGTTSPGAKLDVRGGAIFNENGEDYDLRVEGDTRANLLFVDASTDRVGIGKNNPAVELDVNGWATFNRVGIGTSDPWNALEVIGTITNKGEPGDPYPYCEIGHDADGCGSLIVYGAGTANFVARARESGPGCWNSGWAYVVDTLGQDKAGMIVEAGGDGVVYADTKNFRMANPNQPETEIWYACIEGPEAAAYLRGTARLEKGTAAVAFPDHFQAVITAQGMTVQLTPWSAESEGLAVTQRSLGGFEVRELRDGTGTYSFDYTVMAIRKGYEDYQVIRPVEREDAEERPGLALPFPHK